jgi:hypothetical protein
VTEDLAEVAVAVIPAEVAGVIPVVVQVVTVVPVAVVHITEGATSPIPERIAADMGRWL